MADLYQTSSQTINSRDTRFEQVPLGVPDYSKFQFPTIVTGKKGREPGELYHPNGVAIDLATHQIFVADYSNSCVEVFSETGEHIYRLKEREVIMPVGVAIHGDNVYVSCWDDSVSRFSLTDMSHVRKVGNVGFQNGNFNFPGLLTTDHIGRVFITDKNNDRISIHDVNLNHLYNIRHKSISRPYDVKISRDHLYILSEDDNPCLHVLTLEGDKLRSLLIRGEGMDSHVSCPQSFCFDPLNNFVVSDKGSCSIRVFSQEGNLLHTIGGENRKHWEEFHRKGVAITPSGRLVCVTQNEGHCLEIFC